MESKPKYKRISKQEFFAGNKMRRQILSICHELPAFTNLIVFNKDKGRHVVDMKRLDEFILERKIYPQKPLNYCTVAELQKMVSVFKKLREHYYKK